MQQRSKTPLRLTYVLYSTQIQGPGLRKLVVAPHRCHPINRPLFRAKPKTQEFILRPLRSNNNQLLGTTYWARSQLSRRKFTTAAAAAGTGKKTTPIPFPSRPVELEESYWQDYEQPLELPLEPVLKVYAHTTSPNYFLPWQMKPTTEKSGSGFVLPDRKILTNAHVVADHTFITVRRFGGTQKYPAKVLSMGHDCDLALLTVENDEFWTGLQPLQFGDIPHLQDTVAVVGYPTGGDNISVTRGVVSRIEPQRYAHAAGFLLAIQIDAAINPGNSGGPVLMDNKVVGVAFQSMIGATNIGFIIPVPIIKHFLADIERNGRYTGFVGLGIQCQPLENPQLRQFLQMEPNDSGVLINHVEPVSGAKNVLQKDDVLMAIDHIKIANNGTIPFRKRERIDFDYLLSTKYIGDTCRVSILRGGRRLELDVPLAPIQPLVPVHRFDQRPSYFIHGGLVFTPLTHPYLLEYGEDWYNTSPRKLCVKALSEFMQEPDQEVVILSNVLVHGVNYGYQQMTNQQLLKFNGQKVRNLKHLMFMVRDNAEPYLRFDFDDNLVIIMSAEEAKKAEEEILKHHHIPAPQSTDLLLAARNRPSNPQPQ